MKANRFFAITLSIFSVVSLLSCGGGGGGDSTPTSSPANNTPVALDDAVSTSMNVAVDISALANDTDQDGDSLTVASVTQGASGTVTINKNGSLHYTADTDFTGLDTFTYTISDGKGGAATATVRVTIIFTSGLPIARVNVASDGTEGNWHTWMGAISPDGRYAAFFSGASNLVPGGNHTGNIFVKDRLTALVKTVSVASDGSAANSSSQQPSVSLGARYVAFASWASNLVAGDTNGIADIFVHDTRTGVTSRVSVASDGTEADQGGLAPSISEDGRYVAFYSNASNLVPVDNNGNNGDIFVHDRVLGTTTLVSVESDGTQIGGGAFYSGPSISGDGRYVAFQSGTHIYVRDLKLHVTTLVSVASNGTGGNDFSDLPVISSDGRYVAFSSIATNLVPNDTNGVRDVFVHDMVTGSTIRASVGTGGIEGNGAVPEYDRAAISGDGRFIAFVSAASNLVAGDTNGVQDVFVYDRETNQTRRVSVAADGTEAGGTSGDAVMVSISVNGGYIVFTSEAANLVPGDTNGFMDVFASPNPLMP